MRKIDSTLFEGEFPTSKDAFEWSPFSTYGLATDAILDDICIPCNQCDSAVDPVVHINTQEVSTAKIKVLQSDDTPPPANCPLRGATVDFYMENVEVTAMISQ